MIENWIHAKLLLSYCKVGNLGNLSINKNWWNGSHLVLAKFNLNGYNWWILINFDVLYWIHQLYCQIYIAEVSTYVVCILDFDVYHRTRSKASTINYIIIRFTWHKIICLGAWWFPWCGWYSRRIWTQGAERRYWSLWTPWSTGTSCKLDNN